MKPWLGGKGGRIGRFEPNSHPVESDDKKRKPACRQAFSSEYSVLGLSPSPSLSTGKFLQEYLNRATAGGQISKPIQENFLKSILSPFKISLQILPFLFTGSSRLGHTGPVY
jgi:hypothetical protein